MFFNKILPATVLAFSFGISHAENQTANDVEQEPQQQTAEQKQFSAEKDAQIKMSLKTRLEKFDGFSANFSQAVIDADGNTLQNATGKLVVKRPNLIYWETMQPDETLVISDGDTLWFYNPFVEQVSAFNVSNAVVNTPILLLSDTSTETWQDYLVTQQSSDEYSIKSLNSDAQVKSLNLFFAGDNLAMFTIVDATGQLSHFNLSNMVTTPVPADSIFKFTLPVDVDFDDQR
ncbi:outer membrane lipoprotein chaperone LolA [Colwelliaceae bacterium BS250]